jgi:hypothetical protein
VRNQHLPKLLILVAVVAQLVPHPFNLSPIGALGLFAGAHVRPRLAWLVPLVALAIGDAIMGFYDPVVTAGVYLGFLAGPLLGHLLLGRLQSPLRVACAVVGSGTVFFLISNLAMWLSVLSMYPRTLDGLVACYVNGLPLFGWTLLGDAAYATALFGGVALAPRLAGWIAPAGARV